MNITKGELTFSDSGDAIYTVQIKDFYDKMKNWAPATSICTKVFKVQNVPLYLQIFPNGKKDSNRGYVSIFLQNHSSKPIFVNCKFQVSNLQEKQFWKSPMSSKSGLGFADLCNHAVKLPDFKSDENLQVTCTIMKITMDKVVWDTNFKLNESKRKHDETC